MLVVAFVCVYVCVRTQMDLEETEALKKYSNKELNL